MGIFLIAAAVVAGLFWGDPANRYEGPPAEAVQYIYRDGVPHTDRHGARLTAFDPAKSFFPIGIYHALDGEFRGRRFDMAALRRAGFNTVHGWEGQSLREIAEPAVRNGLQFVYHHPTDSDVTRWRSHPALLAWYLDEDPSIRDWAPNWAESFDRFETRMAAIHALDPGRAVFPLDGPFIDPPRRDRWLVWNGAGDLSAHWNYPFVNGSSPRLTGRRGVPESVTTAVRLNDEAKPVWLVVQAFASERYGWRMPSPQELRASVYAGLIHGATGIFYFSLDSFVSRDGQVLGVAPWTEETYGPSPDYDGDGHYPLVVSAEDAAQSRDLWRAISELNREIEGFVPELLSPTARLTYSVTTDRDNTPVRTLLKRRGDELTLFAVNVEPDPVEMSVTIAGTVGVPRLLAGVAGHFSGGDGKLHDRLPGFGASVYRLKLGSPQ
jgi:hypothetical protein